MKELLLQVDGVRGDDGLSLMLLYEAQGGKEVGEGFSHACASLNKEGPFFQ